MFPMAGALRSVVLNLDGLLRSDGLGGTDDSLSKYLSDHINIICVMVFLHEMAFTSMVSTIHVQMSPNYYSQLSGNHRGK